MSLSWFHISVIKVARLFSLRCATIHVQMPVSAYGHVSLLVNFNFKFVLSSPYYLWKSRSSNRWLGDCFRVNTLDLMALTSFQYMALELGIMWLAQQSRLPIYATRVNVTVESGVPVIVSQLFITASELIPTSLVTCRINGSREGLEKSTSFNITGIYSCSNLLTFCPILSSF